MLNTHTISGKIEDGENWVRPQGLLNLPGDFHLVHWALHCAAAACRPCYAKLLPGRLLG